MIRACSNTHVLLARRALQKHARSTALRTLLASSSSFSSSSSNPTTRSKHCVVNAVGADRPGIVSELTFHVTEAGGNVNQSQATTLGEHFSLMMKIEVPFEASMTDLQSKLSSLSGMNASIFETTEDVKQQPRMQPIIGYSGRFRLSGADHPGLVYKLTSYLASKGFSIHTMKTTKDDVVIAPHGGTSLFVFEGIAHVYQPLHPDFHPNQIKSDLQDLGDSMNCDIQMHDYDPMNDDDDDEESRDAHHA